MSEQSVVVELGRQASFWRSASGGVVGGGFSGGLSKGAAGVVVGGLGRVGYRRQDGVRLALLVSERQYSHVGLHANCIWPGNGQYSTRFWLCIYFQLVIQAGQAAACLSAAADEDLFTGSTSHGVSHETFPTYDLC